MAFVYGATGSTNFADIQTFLADNVLVDNGLLLAGLAFMLVGFGFKVAAVPFHMWAPDVYQGAPTPVTAYMAAGVKTAGFAGMAKVGVRDDLRPHLPRESGSRWSPAWPCAEPRGRRAGWRSCRRTSSG
ncbi:MAG: proton-conducting transporter membrane subunit [Microthrixaceae bacterium]